MIHLPLYWTLAATDVAASTAIKTLIDVFYHFNLGVWFESIKEDHTGEVLPTVHFKLTDDDDVLHVSHSMPLLLIQLVI